MRALKKVLDTAMIMAIIKEAGEVLQSPRPRKGDPPIVIPVLFMPLREVQVPAGASSNYRLKISAKMTPPTTDAATPSRNWSIIPSFLEGRIG
jgi:hypothetical protein